VYLRRTDLAQQEKRGLNGLIANARGRGAPRSAAQRARDARRCRRAAKAGEAADRAAASIEAPAAGRLEAVDSPLNASALYFPSSSLTDLSARGASAGEGDARSPVGLALTP
jgi:hypothetical protein